jgi:hypothetical protein
MLTELLIGKALILLVLTWFLAVNLFGSGLYSFYVGGEEWPSSSLRIFISLTYLAYICFLTTRSFENLSLSFSSTLAFLSVSMTYSITCDLNCPSFYCIPLISAFSLSYFWFLSSS